MEDLQQKLEDLEKRVAVLEKNAGSQASSPKTGGQKQLSPKEFLLSKAAKSATQKTLVLAYYLEHVSGQTSFNIDDIEHVFRAAKEKPPANVNDMVNKNIQKGHLMEDAKKKGDKKAWVLTSSGEIVIENNFKEA